MPGEVRIIKHLVRKASALDSLGRCSPAIIFRQYV
jgi:hypothetical protein